MTFRLRFWGTRGSVPSPGPMTVRYGGNTPCVEVRTDANALVILDAGTGIRELGRALVAGANGDGIAADIFLTHAHWDHIQGLPFFLPAYNEKNALRLLGYEGARAGLATILASQLETSVFPVSLRDMPSAIEIEELRDMEFKIGKVQVEARFVNHPGICVGYRLNTTNGAIAYLPDNEPYDVLKSSLAKPDKAEREKAQAYAAAARAKLVDFLRGVDVLIIDSQYTDEEYEEKVGWGHGSLSSVVSLALDADTRKLFLFHHDPSRDDKAIDAMVESARMLVLERGKPMEVDAAREGSEVWLGRKV